MRVAVIGTGYVGLVTGACLASRGHSVCCVDVSEERVRSIQAGKSPFYEPGLDELLREQQAAGRLSCTTNLGTAMTGAEVSLIAVGTPAKGENPDLSYLQSAAAQVGAALGAASPFHVVCVKSTVVPGTTRGIVAPILARASGRKPGEFGLAMNPEFLREGSALEDFLLPDRIVIGQADNRSGDVLEALYSSFACEKPRVALEEAELIKYASNALLSVLISFGNELAGVCEATPGTDMETVMRGLNLDRRLSPAVNGQRVFPEILSYLRPGIGFGGSCLPKDVNALRVYGKRIGACTRILDAVMATNAERPARVVNMAEALLGGLEGKDVALLGMAFKAGTDDLRSSPAIVLHDALRSRGAHVRAYDSHVSDGAAVQAGLEQLCPTIESATRNADAAVITTTDPAFRAADWARVAAGMRTAVIIDGRNALRSLPLPAGLRYYPIGQGGPRPQPMSTPQ